MTQFWGTRCILHLRFVFIQCLNSALLVGCLAHERRSRGGSGGRSLLKYGTEGSLINDIPSQSLAFMILWYNDSYDITAFAFDCDGDGSIELRPIVSNWEGVRLRIFIFLGTLAWLPLKSKPCNESALLIWPVKCRISHPRRFFQEWHLVVVVKSFLMALSNFVISSDADFCRRCQFFWDCVQHCWCW